MQIAQFNRFEIEMPDQAVTDCSHSGACDEDVSFWAPKITRDNERCTPESLRAELSEYGAWDDEELSDDGENWKRIVWLAAGNIREESAV